MTTGNDDLFFIAPTGSGKSLGFSLPLVILQQTFVVIVPFISLVNDLENRANGFGMQVVVWNSFIDIRTPPQLLIVSVEAGLDKKLKNYLGQLIITDTVKRIVFDEAHEFLEATYRPKLQELIP